MILEFVIRYLKKHFWLFIISLLTTVASSLLSMLFVKTIQNALEHLDAINTSTIFVKFASVLSIISLLVAIRISSTSYMVAKIVKNIREEIFENVIKIQPYSNLKKRIGDIITTLNSDTVTLENCLSVHYPVFLRNIFTICISLIMLLITNIELFSYLLLSLGLVTISAFIINKKVKSSSDKMRCSLSEFSSYVEEFLSKILLVQAFNYEEKAITKINTLIKGVYDFFLSYSRYRSILILSIICIVFSSISFIISNGIYKVVSHQIPLGNFAAFIMYLIIAVNSLSQTTESFSELIQLKSIIGRVLALINISNEKNKNILLDQKEHTICFSNVSFKYPNSANASLTNLSFKIHPNDSIAIVGNSGAGKSTIFQLLLGFYENFEGTITIDNSNINDINKTNLHSLFAWVPQENSLFTGTILENMALGNDSITTERIMHIAHEAKVLDFAEKLPEGLNTVIGENIMNLSYGQKQRISIARALLKDAPILLFDEPTSALDNINENAVMQSIQLLTKSKTIVMVTHKFSNLKYFNKIIFMHNGQILGLGMHEELMAIPEYKEMYLLENPT